MATRVLYGLECHSPSIWIPMKGFGSGSIIPSELPMGKFRDG